MPDANPAIVLFREDLRISDNAALSKAAACGAKVICLYVHDDRAPFARGSAQKWWLHHSLAALSRGLRQIGCPLNIRSGVTEDVLDSVIAESGADKIFWSRRYSPHHVARDRGMMANLRARDIQTVSCKGRLLAEPWETLNQEGRPYRVFTAFWKCLLRTSAVSEPLPAPGKLAGIELPGNRTASELDLLPSNPDWSAGFRGEWRPGEDGAQTRLRSFLAHAARSYAKGRDFPSLSATSRLSPHIQMGEISPRQILRSAARHHESGAISGVDFEKLHAELAWRDFNCCLLYYFPELPDREFNPAFRDFPWRTDPGSFSLWTKGKTGYPIVDAGMRELWQTGFMHNRVRMITASFLTKHLLIDWRAGMDWFWDTLLDADLASNTMNWQWVAGCGADAAPYFRIFNPVLQARKFDRDGDYIRRWAPEISRLPDRDLAEPWSARPEALESAGIKLGETYPLPVIDHKFARQRALEAYRNLKPDTGNAGTG